MNYKKLLLLSVFTIALVFYSLAQVKIGVKGGLNMAVLSGTVNMNPTFKPGLNVGLISELKESERVAIQAELYFSMMGAKIDYEPFASGETKTSLNYLSVPVVGKIYLSKFFNLQLGPEVGILLSARDKGEIDGDEVNEDLKSIFKKTDVGISFGIGIEPTENFQITSRINYGVADISLASKTIAGGIQRPNLNNRAIQISLGYFF